MITHPVEIPLTKGYSALIDECDAQVVSRFKWSAHVSDCGVVYARASTAAIFMHRLILAPARTQLIDHVDGNGLNNQRFNIRVATHQQNMMNRRTNQNNTSGFKGVTWDKNACKWRAQIRFQTKRYNLGYFDQARDAGIVYERAANQLFGDFVRTRKEASDAA